MSHGSYDLNMGSEILIRSRIRSRSWPNIDGTYGTQRKLLWKPEKLQLEVGLLKKIDPRGQATG